MGASENCATCSTFSLLDVFFFTHQIQSYSITKNCNYLKLNIFSSPVGFYAIYAPKIGRNLFPPDVRLKESAEIKKILPNFLNHYFSRSFYANSIRY